MTAPDWWRSPRRIHVVVDNPSWILPYAEELVTRIAADGDHALLARDHEQVGPGLAAFYLGCTRITPPEVLARNRFNLVVHESDLPRGRGFAPLTWQILEGRSEIPVCLLEAAAEADAGPVLLRDVLRFEGHELHPELRAAQGRITVDLCLRFLASPEPPAGEPQQGSPTTYRRRRPGDSELDPARTLAEQFNLLRVVDNETYPAFFRHAGHLYRLKIEKAGREEEP
jgi:methionyl-tRNA formyltransferase